MIYLDNAATTIVPSHVIKTMIAWMNKGNPSASYASAEECRNLMEEFRKFIAEKCNFTSYEENVRYTNEQLPNVYQIVFTSGASEANNTIIRSIAQSYRYHKKVTPHFVVSGVEHRSILDAVDQLVQLQLAEVTIVAPTKFGFIEPEDVKQAIKSNTALVCVMSANNETGAINNIRQIGALAHDSRVPLHTDAVQSFGKFLIDPVKFNVDSFSVSFHKMHADKGLGALVIKRQFLDGYRLLPQISGTQNCGFRGGTENITGIAGSYEALKMVWQNRDEKNKNLADMKRRLIEKLGEVIKCQTYQEYLTSPLSEKIQLVVSSPCDRTYLPNIILIAVIKNDEPPMCNAKLKKQLEDRGVIVSIGSACNTMNAKASHVATAMGLSQKMKRGIIRISLADTNTMDEMNNFAAIFDAALKATIAEL